MIAVELIVIDVVIVPSGRPSNERRHVLDRVDGDAHASDFARGERVVRVVTHLRGEIERDAQARDALCEQIPVAPVRFLCRPKPGVLPHRPQASPIHGRLDAARERERPRLAERVRRRPAAEIAGRVKRAGGWCRFWVGRHGPILAGGGGDAWYRWRGRAPSGRPGPEQLRWTMVVNPTECGGSLTSPRGARKMAAPSRHPARWHPHGAHVGGRLARVTPF